MKKFTVHEPIFSSNGRLIGRQVGESDDRDEANRIALETEDVSRFGHVQVIWNREDNLIGDAYPVQD